MAGLARRSLRGELDDRPGCSQGLDRRDAEFDCLLYGQVHTLAARHALGEQQIDRAFRAALDEWAGSCYYRLTFDAANAGLILTAETVKQHDGIAHLKSQGTNRVVRRVDGQADFCSAAELVGDKKTASRLHAALLYVFVHC